MSKLSRNIGLFGAFILLFLDVLAIYGCFGLKGADLFNQVIETMLPCGLVTSIFAFSVLFEKTFKKAIGIIAGIVLSIAAIARLIVGVLFIDQISSENLISFSSEETLLNCVEVFAFVPLVISVSLLVIYVLKGKMKKSAQIVGGIPVIALLCVWAVRIYQLVSESMSEGIGFVEIYLDIFEMGLVWDILLIGGYAFVLSSLTGALEKKE